MTEVVCVKVNSIRPRYHNLKEWMADPNNVYIGRKGIVFIEGKRFPEQESIWANPYKIGKDGDRNEVLQKYYQYILNKLNSGQIAVEELHKLKGKQLGCWCKPELCHGDILVEILKQIE